MAANDWPRMTEREKLELIRRIFVQGSKSAVTEEVRATAASFIASIDQDLAALDGSGGGTASNGPTDASEPKS